MIATSLPASALNRLLLPAFAGPRSTTRGSRRRATADEAKPLLFDLRGQRADLPGLVRFVEDDDVLVREVELQLDGHEQGDDAIHERRDLARESSLEECAGLPMLVRVARPDDRANGLRAGQVDLAVQQRPTREFAGFGRTRAARDEPADDEIEELRGSQGVALDHVLAGVGRGRREAPELGRARGAARVEHEAAAPEAAPEGAPLFGDERASGDRERRRTRHPDDAARRRARPGAQRDDRLLAVHAGFGTPAARGSASPS